MIFLCLLLQLATLLFAKTLLRYWMHPVLVLVLLWTVLSMATVLFAPEYYFSAASYVAIILFQVAAVAGAVVGFAAIPPRVNDTLGMTIRGARLVSWASLFIGLVGASIILQSKGNTLSVLLDFAKLAEVSRDFSVARYQEDYRMPLAARICQMFVFAACLICGAQFAVNRKSMRGFEFFLPLLALVSTVLVLTTRATFIYGALFWLSAYLAGRYFCSSSAAWQPFTKRGALFSIFGSLLFTAGFVWIQMLRGGIVGDMSRLPEVIAHLKKWPFGSLAGFSVWFDSKNFSEPTFGYFFLTGLFDLAGIRARETGIFSDYVDIGNGDMANIFTLFRVIIDDFTYPGAALFMLLLGFASSFAVSITVRRSIFGIALLSAIYPLVLFSPIVGFYSYLGHVVAVVFFATYMPLMMRRLARDAS
jgi:hypothetical protein